MKKEFSFLLLILLSFLTSFVSGQTGHSNIQKINCPDNVETTVCKAIYFDVSPPLIEMAKSTATVKKRKNKELFENFQNPKYDIYGRLPFMLAEDPVWQKQDGTYLPQTTGPIQNFEGVGDIDNVMPPDTQGDVSNDKYLQVVNSRYAIFSKTGTVILAGTPLSTIWSGIPAPYNNTNDGDPVVLWDQVAQRWMISQFSLPSPSQNAELVAISATSDPSGAWYRYVFQFGNQMPDYPKLGVWPDGYYLAFNQFTNQSAPNGTGGCALERAKMLLGDPTAQMVYKNLGTSADPFAMLPSDWDGTVTPPAGDPNYFMYFNDWSAGGPYLRIWSFHVDWVTPTLSTFAQTFSLPTAAFNSTLCSASRGRCIPEPGGTSASYKLEDLADRLMYRNQYRNFSTYQTMVTSHTVNVGTGVAGCRWYELRNSGSGWTIYQQGTYSPDGVNRWVPSVAMNGTGDIALGYSVSDATSVYPGIRYTGRRSTDPLGTMTVSEQLIIAGTGSQNYGTVGRWGDYAMMSVDPTDDQTFWFTSEYMTTTGSFNWHTRIASFKFSNNPAVTTTAATAITTVSATLNGTINPNGLSSTYHFEWGTTTAYGTNTTTNNAGSGSVTLPESVNITGLTAGTTYHYRLVGVNSDGTTNGNDMTVTPGAATITTTAATAITMTTATSGGNVTADGGSAVSARGLCWSTTANPTITGSHTTDGSGLGVFTSNMTGLTANTLYHIRAYATNPTGTWYGNDLTFNTLCGVYTLPFSESFTGTTIPNCWSQVDHQGSGQIWQFGTITAGNPNPILTGNYAYLNSDGYGSGGSQNADLISPVLDCSAFSNVTLQFSHYFKSYTGSSGTLSYTINGGTTWTTLQTFTTTSATNPATYSQVITPAAGQSQVQFQWNYTGSFAWYWAFDNVQVTGTSTNTLSVTPPNQNVPASPAGSTTFNVTSSTSWSASSNQSWCTVTPSGTGNGTITADYTENALVGNRVATITVTASGAPTQMVTVTQAGVPATLSVTPPNQNVPDSPAGSTDFTVTSNTSWSVVSDSAWCIVTPSGSGNGTITASYPVNPYTITRVAHITVTVAGLTPVVVTVTQAASLPSLSVTPPNQNVAYPSGNITFTVLSNSAWTASSDSSWLTVTPSGTGNGFIDAAFLENPYYTSRIATITVVVAGIPAQMVTVTQAQSTVSVTEHTAGSFRIIPNPAKGTFRVDVGDLKFKSLNVTITDVNGKIILYKLCWEKQDMKFDLSGTPDGLYVVKVSGEDIDVNQKLILKH